MAVKDKIKAFITSVQSMGHTMSCVTGECMMEYSDISKREFTFLISLGKQKQMIMREVADFLMTPMSTATGIIDKLITKGYVVREYSPEDRRIVIVKLSEMGLKMYNSMEVKMYEFGEKALMDLSDKEAAVLTDLLNKSASSGLKK